MRYTKRTTRIEITPQFRRFLGIEHPGIFVAPPEHAVTIDTRRVGALHVDAALVRCFGEEASGVVGYVAGVDWSENIGGSELVVAAVFVAADEMSLLDDELARVRAAIRKGEDYVFKHVRSREDARLKFYPMICRIPTLAAHVLILNNATWINQYRAIKVEHGDPRACHAIGTLLTECPDHLLDDLLIRIDLPKIKGGIKKTEVAYRTALRKTMKMARKPAFDDMRACPDHGSDGGIVQVADMIAGEVRVDPEFTGAHLRPIARKITLV